MYVHFLNDSQGANLGGGWTFMRNLEKGLKQFTDIKIAGRIEDADVCFVSGATMVTRQTIDKVQELGKKLVVRLDNVPRNSRNRNTGTSRLIEFSNRADGIVWQCQWAKDYYGELITSKHQEIIYNGVDQEVFKMEGARYDFMLNPKHGPIFLYSRFNRDETKNWEVAWYEYQMYNKVNKDGVLVLVGNFSPEQMQYNFDFFRGEIVKYIPPVTEPEEMARIMRGCTSLLATYYNDCFSNTYLEAMSCGVKLVKVNMSGGTPEMLELWKDKGRDYFGLERMAKEYEVFFNSL